jgi:hypothetical protein
LRSQYFRRRRLFRILSKMVAVTMARIATPTTTAVTAASLMCADYYSATSFDELRARPTPTSSAITSLR